MKLIESSGAGYRLNRKAWNSAYEEGLKKRIIKRLDLFDRPVEPDILVKRVKDSFPYTEESIQKAIEAFIENGEIILENGMIRRS